MDFSNLTTNLNNPPDHVIGIFKPSEHFVSNEARRLVEIVIDLTINFIIANFGIASNIIIIVVFYKQGYKETMNISMTAIALWDLFKCAAGSLQRMSGPISLFLPVYAISWTNIMLSVMKYLIAFTTYVSSVLAAYVAVERCICVTMPLMVKTILTPRFTFIAMMVLSIVVFAAFAIIFSIFDIVWIFDPQYNESIAQFTYSEFYYNNKNAMMTYYNLSGVVWPLVSFLVIVVCTLIIIHQLRKASKFRLQCKVVSPTSTSMSNSMNSNNKPRSSSITDRDKQVVKMLVVIIVIYIFNLFPRIALYIAKLEVYELYYLREYHNLFAVFGYVLFSFDLCNASINLFVFLKMSSNFQTTFKDLFGMGIKNGDK